MLITASFHFLHVLIPYLSTPHFLDSSINPSLCYRTLFSHFDPISALSPPRFLDSIRIPSLCIFGSPFTLYMSSVPSHRPVLYPALTFLDLSQFFWTYLNFFGLL